ncbi:MAG: hypothetical protein ACREEC_08430, partial [Thermoplasmata archaeon]
EGEVTQWPRGLAGYVSSGPEDATPSPEEDRTGNRLRLTARLLAVLRAHGRNVDREVKALTDADSAFARGDKPRATRLVDRLLAELDERPLERAERPGDTETL